jgi:antitoxin FitA
MVAITIRNVPEHIRDELAIRAARSGRSLQEYLALQLVELASTPAAEDVIARARERARAVGKRLSAESIVADRDADQA